MTTRLKRKLGELGVDTSSRKANESFCLIGTPLPPLEKSKDLGEFVPLWKQEVRDEKGRRRLHGAFTGGFSAGYFNTVGSKEGWAPSTFVSSRKDRAKQKTAKPEDFMDEEDLQEIRDSQTLVDTTDEMDLTGGTEAELRLREGAADLEQDPIVSALEVSLLPTPKDSVGARILKKMNWRPGQGIGPRVTLRQRKLQDLLAQNPASGLTIADIKINEEEEEANKHLYARRDIAVLQAERKDNFHGLGYQPGMGLNQSLGVKQGKEPAGPKLSSGFGLGALNEADEDDLDVYDSGPGNTRSRLAYDSMDHGDDEMISVGSKKAKPIPRPASSVSTFQDGTQVLAGFTRSDRPMTEDRWYPIPDIPKGWTPDPKRIWDKHADKENQPKNPVVVQPHYKWKTGISADERGSILGETPLPSATRSIFEYMSEKDRERIQSFASNKSQTNDPDTKPITSVTRTEPHIAQAALQGFQPFKANPVKQARYTIYLQSQASQDNSVSQLEPLPDQKPDDFHRELEEYAKSALLFKPMSAAMAGRFTSASVLDYGPNVHEGLHKPTEKELAEKEEQKRKEEEDSITPKQHAAMLGMFGTMTRETKTWQPAKLLCKRFGVKDPNPVAESSSGNDMDETTGDTSSGPSWQQGTDASAHASSSATGQDAISIQAGNAPRDLENIGLGEDETQGRDTLTYQRPPMDVFKAIFADDEDSDDEKDVQDDDDDEQVVEDITSKKADEIPVKVITENAPVNISIFKPTFIPREGKSKQKREGGDEKNKEKKKRKKEKEKKGVLSFDVDEGGGSQPTSTITDRPKKKKRKEKREEDGTKNGMWLKEPSEGLKNLVVHLNNPEPMVVDGEPVDGPLKGRKRAVDFM